MTNRFFRYALFDPSGNTTALLIDPVPKPYRASVVRQLLDDQLQGIEQVGFLTVETEPGGPAPLPRLEMMGGEFCGNAARATGAWVAMHQGRPSAKQLEIMLTVSGSGQPVRCLVDLDEIGTAQNSACQMPLPEKITFWQAEIDGRRYSVPRVDFPGITHLILADIPADASLLPLLVDQLGIKAEAVGVMFTRDNYRQMIPLVYVAASASTVFEGGCGSGTAAVGALLAFSAKASISATINQPAGKITVEAQYQGEQIQQLTISGDVNYKGIREILVEEMEA
jgi:diaminopimelate epimerase